MRYAFELNAAGLPASVRLTDDGTLHAAPAFHVGQRIELLRGVNLDPYAHLAAGERGVVASVDPDTGVVDIKMELLHLGLAYWFNCMWLVPFETEELLSAVRLIV